MGPVLGFAVVMSVVKLRSLSDYWNSNHILHCSAIAGKITRERFRVISRYLHFVDNNSLVPRGLPGYDRLGKVRPMLEKITKQFQKVYNLQRDVAIDEAMIKFQGRSSMKQYMPQKHQIA